MKGPPGVAAVTTGLHTLPHAALYEHNLMTPDQRRALRRLADVPRGIAQSLMLAHGFSRELISGLVLFGLATVVTDTVRIGAETIAVELVMITDAGRRVLESVTAREPPPRLPEAQ
jgi:hypothetical protein